jgi:hypothetical protein
MACPDINRSVPESTTWTTSVPGSLTAHAPVRVAKDEIGLAAGQATATDTGAFEQHHTARICRAAILPARDGRRRRQQIE